MDTKVGTQSAYEGDCPARQILDRIADKWTALVIGVLSQAPAVRFTELRRSITGISQKMLTQTLRELERDGLVTRTVYAVVPPRVEYRLTPLGQTLGEPLQALSHWASAHMGEIREAQERFDAAASKRSPTTAA